MAILRSWLVILELLERCLSPLGLFIMCTALWPWLALRLPPGMGGSWETALYLLVLAVLLQEIEAC